jgi:hypothetical protein
VTESVPHAGTFASFLVGALVLQTKNARHQNLLRCLHTGSVIMCSAAEMSIDHHLVRRGAGAEDEALGEAVPAELGVRDVARQSCEKQRGEGPPRHFRRTGAGIVALLVMNWWCQHCQFRALFVEGTAARPISLLSQTISLHISCKYHGYNFFLDRGNMTSKLRG